MEILEEKIGYKFNNPELLNLALTHSSLGVMDENNLRLDNERLEFIGDGFLDAVVGAELYTLFGGNPEGVLTKLRAEIVCEKSLADIGRGLNLNNLIRMGSGEIKTGVHERDSVIADGVEAIIGAVYLDGGFDEMRKVTLNLVAHLLEKAKKGTLLSDYKSRLQEYYQKLKSDDELEYVTVKEEGPDHDKTFYIEVRHGEKVLGRGSGKTKKEAEKKAAMDALKVEE